MIGAIARGARGQRIRYCRKPDFAVMYADGQCAHYRTNSGQGVAGPATGPSVLPLPLPVIPSLSRSLANGGAEREAVTRIPLLAQIEGPTR